MYGPSSHESFIHWSLGSRESLRCLSKYSKCLLPRAPQKLPHTQRRSIRSVLSFSLSKAPCQYMRTPSYASFRLPLFGLIFPRWKLLWLGAHSWSLLTGHFHTSFPNLTHIGVNGKKGRTMGTTPPTTPSSLRFHLKFPPSRPPSHPLP